MRAQSIERRSKAGEIRAVTTRHGCWRCHIDASVPRLASYLGQKSVEQRVIGVTLAADGSIAVVNDSGGSTTVSAAAALAVDTNYVLVVLRDALGDYTVRVNGVAVGVGANDAGAITLARVGDSTGGIAIDLAELLLCTGTDYSDDTAALAQLERYLGYMVGVEL